MKKETLIFIIILVLGILLRIYAFSQIASADAFTWIGGDNSHYYEVASNIYDGRGPVIDFVFQFWERVGFGMQDALWEPLFPYSLALTFFLFGQSILVGKIAVFVFSMAAVVLIYFIGKIIYGSSAGLIAAFLLAVHPKHIEYSVSLFKDNLYVLLFLFAFLFMVLSFKHNKLHYWSLLGVFLALAFLTRYIAAGLILTLFILLIINRKKVNWKFALIGGLISLMIVLPWAIYTYNVFEQPLFSITKYYSYSSNGWEGMSFESVSPSIGNYLESNSFLDIILSRLNLIPLTVYFLPILFNPFIFIFVLLIFLLKDPFSKSLKIYFLVFMSLYFLQFSNNNLFIERAFFPLIYVSLVPIGFIISNIPRFVKENKVNVERDHILAVIMVVILISSLGLLQWKLNEIKSYEMLERQKALRDVGGWVKENLSENAIIMTVQPSDVHFYFERKTVMDPYNFALNMGHDINKYKSRSKEEIVNYRVTHLLIHTKNKNALDGFGEIDKDLIYEDEKRELLLYEVKED